jgi:hypothetical protein
MGLCNSCICYNNNNEEDQIKKRRDTLANIGNNIELDIDYLDIETLDQNIRQDIENSINFSNNSISYSPKSSFYDFEREKIQTSSLPQIAISSANSSLKKPTIIIHNESEPIARMAKVINDYASSGIHYKIKRTEYDVDLILQKKENTARQMVIIPDELPPYCDELSVINDESDNEVDNESNNSLGQLDSLANPLEEDKKIVPITLPSELDKEISLGLSPKLYSESFELSFGSSKENSFELSFNSDDSDDSDDSNDSDDSDDSSLSI